MTITNGPWATPEPKTLDQASIRGLLNAAIHTKRTLQFGWDTKQSLLRDRAQIRRLTPRAKASRNLVWYRANLDANAKLTQAIDAFSEELRIMGRNMLSLLGALDGALSDQEAGALLGIHHQHVELRSGE